MNEFNILFTSAGRRVSLIRSFREAMRELSIDGKLITADCNKHVSAAMVSDFHEVVPYLSDPSYIPTLVKLCKRHEIRLLVPLIDTELQILADHREEFEKIGVFPLVSSQEVNQICFDKRKTALFFTNNGIDTPKVLSSEDIQNKRNMEFPVLLKPFNGSGSKGVRRIDSLEELHFFMKYIPNAMLQEYVSGREYTVDVLVDLQGKACAAVPRLRIETRAGEISKGMTVKDQDIIAAAKKVADALPGAIGCITLQCFVTSDNQILFIEINPRFGGGIPLTIAAGANYPKVLIQWLAGQPADLKGLENWRDGLLMLRYDEAFLVEAYQ